MVIARSPVSVDPDLDAELNSDPSAPSAARTPAFGPLYQQIKELILHSLQTGEWKPGETIPSEFELAARYKVSQGTVRKAIDELASDALLMRRQGRGTFVATHSEQRVRYRFLSLRPDCDPSQAEPPVEREIIDCRKQRASIEIVKILGLQPSEAVFQVRRLLRFEGVPTILEEIWLPAGPFAGLTVEHMSEFSGPMYALFESEFGVRMVRANEKLRAVLPNEHQAQLLDVSPTWPLLSVERIAYTYNDKPMELRRGLYRTDRHHYRNRLN